MPGRPRAGRLVPRWELTPAQLFFLCTGYHWFGDALTEADLSPAWASVRPTVLAVYAAQCPGCRPWCWWLLEAPEPRRCLVGQHDCPQRDTVLRDHKQGRLSYGKPAVYCCERCWAEVYESQARFVRRHALLLPVEASVLPRNLAACDAWAATQYADDHAMPWPLGSGFSACEAFLADLAQQVSTGHADKKMTPQNGLYATIAPAAGVQAYTSSSSSSSATS